MKSWIEQIVARFLGVVTRFSWQRDMFLRRLNRDTISCIVAQFWEGSGTRIRCKTHRGAIYSNRGAILASENISYLNRSWFQKRGLRFWRAKVRFQHPEYCRRGNFIISNSVYVCFNSLFDYAICKLNYE